MMTPLKVQLVAQQARDHVGRERGRQLGVKLRIEDMRYHDHRDQPLANQRAIGHQINFIERGEAAVHGGQRFVWVDGCAPQAREVFQRAYHAARRQALQVSAAHVGYQCGVGAERTHDQTGIVGIGEYVHNGHEIDV